ncbi:hypothetical protein NIES2119_31215 [[Phormidium ambiguum] IAM M-71]|uniref:Uncharacterized protein n=1 Tax=[Phormidium ambiguum] IAM M-71 TaxID=454136 RepID=A0A1U7I2I1_9CYAN|nr:hypothetical protein [Phormidium ambiguum]OKH30310.1 hypothetical protein NIES2119_31215 [Phormidium ambiguum IAM M-71]
MPSPEQITTAISTIDQLSGWLENAGLDQVAIVQFKFNSLAVMYPELKEVAEIAKSAIGSAFPITEEGMTVTELANIITENLGKSIKPDRVNKALVELGYQERNDVKRTWSLTEAGKEHGICLLATSAKNSWSGVQVKWHRSVISVLLNYFQENLEESNSLTINSQSSTEPLQEENASKNGSSNSNSASDRTALKDNSKPKKNWTIAERIKEKNLKSNPEQIRLIQSFADDYYLEKYGTKPPKLAGRKVPTSNYPSEAIEIVDRAIETVFNPKKRSES